MRILQKGLTLVETLVVIGIVAVLAGIITPVTMNAIKSAKTRTCVAQLRQIAQSLEMYSTDYDDRWPPYSFIMFADVPARRSDFKASLVTYGAADELWYCPSDQFARTDHMSEWHDHLDTSYTFHEGVIIHARPGPNHTMIFSTRAIGEKAEFPFLADQTDVNGEPGSYERVSPHSKVRNVVFLDTHVETRPVVEP